MARPGALFTRRRTTTTKGTMQKTNRVGKRSRSQACPYPENLATKPFHKRWTVLLLIARVAIPRLHRQSGHRLRSVLVAILKSSEAPIEHRRGQTTPLRRLRHQRPFAADAQDDVAETVWLQVGLGVRDCRLRSRANHLCQLVDQGTTLQIATLVRTRGAIGHRPSTMSLQSSCSIGLLRQATHDTVLWAEVYNSGECLSGISLRAAFQCCRQVLNWQSSWGAPSVA